jgi:ribosomal protein S18 acetylase RimI-like enzyme
MYLETATTNKAAIALWKKHGYREFGTIENYYGRGQHAFEMEKALRRLPEGN